MGHPCMVLAFTGALCASKVPALTCMAPDPFRKLASTREPSEAIVVLYGRLMLDEPPPPMKPGIRKAWGTLAGAGRQLPRPIPLGLIRFEGVQVCSAGIELLAGNIRIEPSCIGCYFCGIPEGTYLLFAHETPRGLAAEVGFCRGYAFEELDLAVLDVVVACVEGDVCPP